jgi:uncharacterized protein YqfA (UPF0365 family)
LTILLQAFAIGLSRQLPRALEKLIQRAILLDQSLRALFADALDSGNVVDRVAHQRQNVDHLFGRHAEVLLDKRSVIELLAPGVQHERVRTDELHEIFIGTHQLARCAT